MSRLIKLLFSSAVAMLSGIAVAQSVAASPELYAGEKLLYEAARKEGMVVSFDTGPTWANWAAQFRAFKQRYPEVEIVYNDLGSAATVVALDKARNRPQADTAYYFAASAVDAVDKGVVAPFKPVNFDKLPAVFKDPDGRWFTIHSLTIAFVVNTKLVKNVPQSWADLLKPEYKNTVVYLDPRSTGVGQVMSFAANFAAGGDMTNVKPGLEYLGKLHKAGSVLRVLGTTPYAQFVKGEIPIWISYENDGLKAKYHRRPRRRGGGGDPEGGLGRGAVRHQPGREGPEPERRQAVAELHHERLRPGHLRRRLRAAQRAGHRAAGQRGRQAADGTAGAPARRACRGREEGRDRPGLRQRHRGEVMWPTPEAAAPLPLKGAQLADRRSRIRGCRLAGPRVACVAAD